MEYLESSILKALGVKEIMSHHRSLTEFELTTGCALGDIFEVNYQGPQ